MNLSPGQINMKLKGKVKLKRLSDVKRKVSPQYKARRKINFAKRGQITSRNEMREGETYRSGMAFEEPAEIMKILRVWKPPPFTGTLPKCLLNNVFVFFDLETSGLSTSYSEILQISAISIKGEFNVYCQPSKPIAKSASATNMLTVYRGHLQYKGKNVLSMPIKDALNSFLQYLSIHGPCILVAHNASFDMRFLVHNLRQNGFLEKSRQIVVRFIDTLKSFRKKFMDSKKTGVLKNFKLESICKFLLGEEHTFNAHNAQDDVVALKSVFEAATFTLEELSYSGREYKSYMNWTKLCGNGVALDPLAIQCSLTNRDLRALVKNGLTIGKLKRNATGKSFPHFRKRIQKFINSKKTVEALYSALIDRGSSCVTLNQAGSMSTMTVAGQSLVFPAKATLASSTDRSPSGSSGVTLNQAGSMSTMTVAGQSLVFPAKATLASSTDRSPSGSSGVTLNQAGSMSTMTVAGQSAGQSLVFPAKATLASSTDRSPSGSSGVTLNQAGSMSTMTVADQSLVFPAKATLARSTDRCNTTKTKNLAASIKIPVKHQIQSNKRVHSNMNISHKTYHYLKENDPAPHSKKTKLVANTPNNGTTPMTEILNDSRPVRQIRRPSNLKDFVFDI